MSLYSSGIPRRNPMYPYALNHRQSWTDDRRESRRMEMDHQAAPFHDHSRHHAYISSVHRSGFQNAVVPDVRVNRSTHATPFDSSTWPNDPPLHTPDWRALRQLSDEHDGDSSNIPRHLQNFSSYSRVPSSLLGYGFDVPRHIHTPSFGSQGYPCEAVDDQIYERSPPPPPYTPNPATTRTSQEGYSPSQPAQTARSRHHPGSSPSQMQMVRYDPNSVEPVDRPTVRSSIFAVGEQPSSAGSDTHQASNWSNHGSIGHPSPQPYHSEYTHFSNPPAACHHHSMDSYRNYREIHEDILEDLDDGDFMSDGVASDEGVYYSSDGGQFDSLGEDEFEVFSDDGYTSPVDDFYGDD